MGVHLIPVIVYVRDANTRKEAYEFVKGSLRTDGMANRAGRGQRQRAPLSIEFPNDEPDGVQYLTWAEGSPPDVIETEDPDERIIYDDRAGGS